MPSPANAALRAALRAGYLASARFTVSPSLDICVRNHFRNDPEALGAWAIARHIERAPRRTEESTPPSNPPSSGEASGSNNTAVIG